MKAEAIRTDLKFLKDAEIKHINYDLKHLEITIGGVSGSPVVTVVFEDVAGLRVMDEGSLLEFWPDCSSFKGWIFQIYEGGWLAQESQRQGFLLGDLKTLREYFIAGVEDCVNVLAFEDPVILLAGPQVKS